MTGAVGRWGAAAGRGVWPAGCAPAGLITGEAMTGPVGRGVCADGCAGESGFIAGGEITGPAGRGGWPVKGVGEMTGVGGPSGCITGALTWGRGATGATAGATAGVTVAGRAGAAWLADGGTIAVVGEMVGIGRGADGAAGVAGWCGRAPGAVAMGLNPPAGAGGFLPSLSWPFDIALRLSWTRVS
jgi:hypothetical protein